MALNLKQPQMTVRNLKRVTSMVCYSEKKTDANELGTFKKLDGAVIVTSSSIYEYGILYGFV